MTREVADLTPAIQLIREKLGYKPTEAQKPALNCRRRYVLVAGGAQAGKSMTAAHYLIERFPETEGKGLYWLVAADYERTKAEYEYLAVGFEKLGILKSATKRVDPGVIELEDGTKIETKSAKDPRTLAMRAPDGIVACEASQLDQDTYFRIRGRLAPKRGWLFMSGTFEGSLGWYPQLFKAWQRGVEDAQSFSIPSYSNEHFYPGGRDDPEIVKLKMASSDDYFMEHIEGIPSPPKGLVFGEFRSILHMRNEAVYVPGQPVYLWIDPGYGHAYAVECAQIINEQVRVFDEIYDHGLTTEEVIGLIVKKTWSRDIQYGTIDVSGFYHQAMSAPAEVWAASNKEIGWPGLKLGGRKIKITEGIERLKGFLRTDPEKDEPKLVIHPKCQGVLSEFGVCPDPFEKQTRPYRWKVDREGQVVGDAPEDRWNDGVKALIYGIVDVFGFAYLEKRTTIAVKYW